MSDPEQLLRDALQDRADRTPYDATPVGEVETSARRLRRRRRTVVAGLAAAAAVVAVVVPLAVVAAQDPAPDPAPAPTPSVPPSTMPPFQLPEPATGPPQVGFVSGDTYYAPDGSTIQLPDRLSVTEVTPYADGVLVVSTRPGDGTDIARVAPDGTLLDETCGGALATNEDGSLTAWATCDGSIHRGPTAGGEVREISVTGRPVGFLGDGLVVDDTGRGPRIVDGEGDARAVPGVRRVFGVDDAKDVLAATLDDGSAAAVVTPEGAIVWKREDLAALGTFSPGGAYLWGRSRDDGHIQLLDAGTGETLTVMEGSRPGDFPTLADPVWEDDANLLTVARRNCCDAIVRVNLFGELLPVRDGDIGLFPTVLVGQSS